MIPDCHRSRGRLARETCLTTRAARGGATMTRRMTSRGTGRNTRGPRNRDTARRGVRRSHHVTGLLGHSPGATPEISGSAHRRSHPTGNARRIPRVQRWRQRSSYSGKGTPRCSFTSYFQGIVRYGNPRRRALRRDAAQEVEGDCGATRANGLCHQRGAGGLVARAATTGGGKNMPPPGEQELKWQGVNRKHRMT